MDLHPYDGIERCFRHTDSEREAGLALVANVLQLPKTVPVDHAMYDLSFYSGGIGVLDHLAITLPIDSATRARVVEALHGKTPEQVSEDTTWAAELMWLFTGEERAVQIRETAVGFIND